jgi:predicted dehydrogenase
MGRGKMKAAIIGCGCIGQKRAKALGDYQLSACVDIDFNKAKQFASHYPGCMAYHCMQDMLANTDVDIVIIATQHHALAELTQTAIRAKKHVLVEKPAARSLQELEPVAAEALDADVWVRVGFNHRYHRAFIQARKLVDEHAIGDLMFVRARYGHGGRIGYDQEWRANPDLSGGGELIDQGVHLIDLARWFLGDFSECHGFAHTYFWSMPVDDNGFLLLKTPTKQAAFLHASCTEWKNIFSFEIYGRTGKLHIHGLGGSYGVESLSVYQMLPQMGPPKTQIFEYPMQDNSWDIEFAEFVEDIQINRQPAVGLNDALAALKIVNKIYQNSDLL